MSNAGPLESCYKCGATAFVDVAIHDGRSARRECAVCHRFLGFAVWYGVTLEPRPLSSIPVFNKLRGLCASVVKGSSHG